MHRSSYICIQLQVDIDVSINLFIYIYVEYDDEVGEIARQAAAALSAAVSM